MASEGTTRSTSSGLTVITRQADDQYFADIGNNDSDFSAHLVMGRITTEVDGVPASTVFTRLVEMVTAGLTKGPSARSS